jgi:hypothetical protein
MHKIIFFVLFSIVFPSIAFARLGETEQQDIARYGVPIKDHDAISPILNNAVTKTYRYQGWKIRAGYLNGHAVKISYSKLSQPNVSPQLKDDEITAVLNAETHGGKWEKLKPASLFSQKGSGDKLFDYAQLRWGNTNKNIAYIPLGGMILYIETPVAIMWEQSLENQKEVKRKENIPQF